MNLWPFSKKASDALDSHFELPPGVVLAGDDGMSLPPLQAEVSQIEISPTVLEIVPSDTGIQPEMNINPQPMPEAWASEPPQVTQPEAVYPNSHLLDLITPPATPDIDWAPEAQPHAEPVSHIEPQPIEAITPMDLPPTDLVEESFAMAEASGISSCDSFESFPAPGSSALPEEISFLKPSSFEILPEEPTEACLPTSIEDNILESFEPALDNVVPFPVRHAQATEEQTIESPTELAFSLSDVTSSDEGTGFGFDIAVDLDNNDTGSFWGEPEAVSLESGILSFDADEADSFSNQALFEIPVQDLDSEPQFDMDKQDDKQDEPSVPSLESSVLSLDSYDDGSEQPPLDSYINDSHLEPDSNWGDEEEAESSSVKEWATYDMGHYDDPDEPVETLVLGEEPLSPLEVIQEAALESLTIDEALETASFIVSDSSLEPPETLIEPHQGQVVASEWQKSSSPPISKLLNNFSQQVLLEESHAIKRSIDELVEQYFSQGQQKQRS